jgi:hypothetical protein
MSVLTVIEAASNRLGLLYPAEDNNYNLLVAMIEQAAQEIRNAYAWPQLQKEYTLTLATDTASYVLPGDLDRVQFETFWNRTQSWPLYGPIDPVDWQNYKSGLVGSLPRQRFRVKGFADKQFFIDPTPSATEDGQTCVFEYVTKSVFKPKTWVTLTSWAGLQYCSYNGNIYDRGGVGAASTGAAPPTHTSGAVTDGVITWTYLSSAYEYIVSASTDLCLLDEQLIIDGAVWRWKRQRGYEYQELRDDAERTIERATTKLEGARSVSMLGEPSPWSPIGLRNYPVQDF